VAGRRKPPPPHPQASQILALRRAGVSFSVIAKQVDGLADAAAAEAEWERAAESLRAKYSTALEVDRLDRMLVAVWDDVVKGDLDAIDRALKITAMRERLQAAPKDNDGAVAKAYDTSVESSKVLHRDGVDAALVAAGRKIAERIDEATASGDGTEVTKALYLLPHMMNALREMLATPSARLNAEVAQGKGLTGGAGNGGSKLGNLRGIAGGKATGS